MRDRDDVMAPRDPNKRYPAYNVQPQKPKAKKSAKKAAKKAPAKKAAKPSKRMGY